MNQRNPDVLVVGGGPAGSISARTAAEGGAKTVLIDKKEEPARSSACGGLVSRSTWRRLGTGDGPIVHEINGVVVHPPAGDAFELSSPEVKAYVVDRDKLNARLLDRAKSGGVEVRPGTEIVRRDGLRVETKRTDGSGRERLRPHTVIGADGPRSDVRRLFDLERPSKLLYAIQAEMGYRAEKSNYVEVFFGKKVAPGFFAWIIPVNERRARIGLATTDGSGLKDYFNRLIVRAGASAPGDYRTGVIPIGVPDQSCGGPVLTVGDAAGQVKPTTGGGLYPISITGRIAGKVAVETLATEDDPSELYYKRWMRRVGRELKREMTLHRVLEVVSDRKLTRLLNLLNRPGITDWISDQGDIDHLYPLAKKMAKNPLIMGKILKELPGEIAAKLKRELR